MPEHSRGIFNAARLLTLVAALVAGVAALAAQENQPAGESPEVRGYRAVAPGEVEPWSGQIKIGAPAPGLISKVLVGVNDKVFVGEPLIRLDDTDAKARVAVAKATVAMRKRARNDQGAVNRARDRRQAEDAVADEEFSVYEAQTALDAAAAARRGGTGSDADVEKARVALTRADERLTLRRTELRRLIDDKNVPLPTQNEGALNVARAEYAVALAALENLTIRTPIAGTILQVNAKSGEVASPGSPQPLLLVGDVSALRVRAELDERDYGDIEAGQTVLVRAPRSRGRELVGRVSSVAPMVDAARINARDQRGLSDVRVIEVIIDLGSDNSLPVGMKVDVYFRQDGHALK